MSYLFKSFKNNYFLVFLFFIIIEVYTYNQSTQIQSFYSLLEYTYLFILFFYNFKLCLKTYIIFTLISLGQTNFTIYLSDSLPHNYWGIRIQGISLNILFLIILFFKILSNNRFRLNFKFEFEKFFVFFIIYNFIIGLLFVILNINYIDDFIQDFELYITFFFFSSVIQTFHKEELLNMVDIIFFSTFILIIFSFIFNIKMQYGLGNFFILENTFSFIFYFYLILQLKIRNSFLFYLIFLITTFLIINGYIFIGGKQIILSIILIFTFLFKIKNKLISILLILFIFINNDYFFRIIINYFTGNVISFKFNQIYSFFDNKNISTIFLSKSSLGNIISEFLTLIKYYFENLQFLFFGKGFGGGVKDMFGYLTPWAGNSGYPLHDAVRNNFHKLHLPIFDIILKSGIFGVFYFTRNLIFLYNRNNINSKITIFLFITVFYVTKEYFLLSLIFFYSINDFNERENNFI
jgi:hypothetical protein